MTTPKQALELALATIERLDPTGAQATKGTRDVINKVLAQPALPLDRITVDIDEIPDGGSRHEIITIILRRRGKKIICGLDIKKCDDPGRGAELILTASRSNTEVIKRITATPWIVERS